MHEDHADALVLLARHFAGQPAEEATMTRVDRLGFHLRLKAGGNTVPFLRAVRDSGQGLVGRRRSTERPVDAHRESQ